MATACSMPAGAERSLEYRLRTRSTTLPSTPLPVFEVPLVAYVVVVEVTSFKTKQRRFFSIASGMPRREYTLGERLQVNAVSTAPLPGARESVGVVCYRTVEFACRAAQLQPSSPRKPSQLHERRLLQLELGRGLQVWAGKNGELRCSDVLPLAISDVPPKFREHVQPRERWWAPAYGAI
mmetsp:Transcript_35856/g.76537  ORF Transcript_35856/g.76537 Transcript_35856/m.76537 type:complete len:180 (-) Transcript_35856:251-790(-)